jgi:hypothetical protein
MPAHDAEDFDAHELADDLAYRGFKHPRVRRRGPLLTIESGDKRDPIANARLRRETVHLWRLEMPTSDGWEPTPFREDMDRQPSGGREWVRLLLRIRIRIRKRDSDGGGSPPSPTLPPSGGGSGFGSCFALFRDFVFVRGFSSSCLQLAELGDVAHAGDGAAEGVEDAERGR